MDKELLGVGDRLTGIITIGGDHYRAGAKGVMSIGVNQLPAMLSAKGKVNPSVRLRVEANAHISIQMKWQKFGVDREWDCDYEFFYGDDVASALAKAIEFINGLPTAEQAKLQHFMGNLGRLIDAGKSEGIAVEFMNPLLDTMKRLSENVITYKPAPRS